MGEKRVTLFDKEIILKRVKVQYDGKQLFIRIPKEISNFLKIRKGDNFEFKIDIPESLNQPIKSSFNTMKKQNEKTKHL